MPKDDGCVRQHGHESPALRERILPSGTFELVFNLREDELRIYKAADPQDCDRLSGAIVSGPYNGFFITDTAEEACVMGVQFKQGGAFPFLSVPADELADMHIALDYGNFDQSHLIRDFLAFSGFSPADYLRRLSDLRRQGTHIKFNHLPLVR